MVVIPVSPKACGYKYECKGIQFYEKNLETFNEVKLCSGFCFMEKLDEPEKSLGGNDSVNGAVEINPATFALGDLQEKMPLIFGIIVLVGALVILQSFMKQFKGG